ncbi:MAG: hypothetical protein M1833_005834 [Piccolia ochrophora]|nr:MAG: hypothetical protein M1833_005834 [Piccolia ochrophora]
METTLAEIAEECSGPGLEAATARILKTLLDCLFLVSSGNSELIICADSVAILTDAHQLENLRDWQNDRILRWTGNHVQVHMTWGYGPKICWHQMTEVEPKGDLLHSSQWITNTERCQRIVTTSPPLGYANLESIVTKLREKANTYLREFIDGPHMDGFASFAFKDHPLQISLLQVVLQYCAHPSEENADEVRLLRAARKLLVLIYIMTHVISIFPGHKQDVFDVLQYSDLIGPQSSHVTLRLAQRQTKYVLNTLVVDLFRAILKGCEQILRRRKKGGGWAAAFCTLTILAVVSEEMQIAMIMKGQYDAEHGDSGARTKAEQQSKDLEGEGFLRLVDYFHKSFSTHSAKDKPFNPLGDRENEGVEQSLECLDDATKTLVCGRPRMLGQGGLRGIMSHFAEEMDERRRQLILEPDPARHPQANTSRLVSRWLCTFRYTLQYSA